MKSIFLITSILLFFGNSFAQYKTLSTVKLPTDTEKRAAVIFANQYYENPNYKLQKTHNDADDMKEILENIGFTVVVFEKDLKEDIFFDEIQSLEEKLRGYQVVFFYYSGHGVEYRGENYLIPTDIELKYAANIMQKGIKLNNVYDALREAGVKTSIIVLDACRSLPIGKGNPPQGMSIPTNNPAGTFTMYATRAGKIALENLKGRNSYFTQELKKFLPIPNLTLNQIHYKTRQGVKIATNNEQEPGVSNELDGEFTFLLKDLPAPNYPKDPWQDIVNQYLDRPAKDSAAYTECFEKIKNQITECDKTFDFQKNQFNKLNRRKSGIWAAGGLVTVSTGVFVFRHINKETNSIINRTTQFDRNGDGEVDDVSYNEAYTAAKNDYDSKRKLLPYSNALLAIGSGAISLSIVKLFTKKFKGINCQITPNCQGVSVQIPLTKKMSPVIR